MRRLQAWNRKEPFNNGVGMNEKTSSIRLVAGLAIAVFITFGVFQPTYAELETAPKVKMKDIDGNSFKLSDYKGKAVIVNFWAVWCPPCKKEIPSLVDLYTRYGEKGLMVFGIALDSGQDDDIRKKAEEYGVNYPVINGDYYLRKEFGGIRVVPTTLVINQEGKIYKNYLGYKEKEIIEEDLRALLGACEGNPAEKSDQ